MALDCGHRADPDTKLDRVREGVCPGCPTVLEPGSRVMPHGYCSCCGERWAVNSDGEVVQVFWT